MNARLIESIANAVLYEGYMLYPYRPSAVKNRQRWNFGVVYPRPYSEFQKGTDAWFMQTQCLVRGDAESVVDIKARFLQAVSRQIGKGAAPFGAAISEANLEIVESLEVGEKTLQSWQEALEREVIVPSARLADLLAAPVHQNFVYASGRELEAVKDDGGTIAAFIVREREEIRGRIELSADKVGEGIFKITVVISNQTPLENPEGASREDVQLKALLSAHTLLGVTGGEYVSLIDPPAELQQIASECKSAGTWPVLAGEEGSKDAMLSSPIILYDYPQIAPESPGDLFDGTEIDEILSLRIMTLTEEEKREIRSSDDRARQILERTDAMPEEQFRKLHGVVRGLRPRNDPFKESA